MAASTRDFAFAQHVGKGKHLDGVEADQPHITERRREPKGVVELLAAAGRHGNGRVEQKSNGHARLDLEHLEEHLVQPHVGPPIDSTEVVALMEVPMIEELLTAAREV
jgi:hypothetical protein